MPDFVSTTKKSILQVQKVVNISVSWSKFRIFSVEFWLSSFLVVSHIDPGCSGSSIWTCQKVSENFPFAFRKTAQKNMKNGQNGWNFFITWWGRHVPTIIWFLFFQKSKVASLKLTEETSMYILSKTVSRCKRSSTSRVHTHWQQANQVLSVP